MSKNTSLDLKVKETRRVYTFPNDDKVELLGVSEVIVRPSGNHRLKTADGKMHIIAANWIHIEIESPETWVDLPKGTK